ncbi:MAG: replicative DNA helicase, partial [Dolichospermum sp.]
MIDTLRLPPCAIEAEECILGGIMLDPNAIDIVALMLTPQDFYIEIHGKLFEVMVSLHQENKPTDLLFVDQKLVDLGIHQEVGGRNKLATLIDRTVSAANIDALAGLVIEKSIKRKMFIAGNIISQTSLDALVSAEESTEIAEEEIFKISQKQTGDRYQLTSAGLMSIELFECIQSGKMEGQKFGWYDLEVITGGMHKGKLEVVAAESHMGKTHYLVDHAYNVMTQLNLPVLFFSLEMDQNQLNTRMLARITNIDSSEIINNPNKHMEG